MGSSSRVRVLALAAALAFPAALLAGPISAASGRGGRQEGDHRQGGVLRGRRHAPGHRGQVRRAGPHAHDERLPEDGHVGQRRRPAHAGAAEHGCRLVHAGDGRVARRAPAPRTTRSTSTASRSPTARLRSTRACSRSSRSPSRPSEAGSRSPRSSGPVGATPRSAAPRSTSSRSSPAGGSPPTSSAARATPCSTTPPSSPRSGSSSTTPPATRASLPSRAPRRPPATGWTGALPQSYSPPMEMRMRVLDFGTDKYGLNAYIFDSTNDNQDELRQGAVLPHQGRGRLGRHRAPRASSSTSRSRSWAARRPG